ncbi:hypothetical protein [Hyphobacterium sp.]|uniref:hypothetical protein n=1 Tax=Hyphobacterium sp. TaxID=2004662 RepID=UPI003B51D38C
MTADLEIRTPPVGHEGRWCHVRGCGAEPRHGFNVFRGGNPGDELHACQDREHYQVVAAEAARRMGVKRRLPDPDRVTPDRQVGPEDLFGGEN